SMQNFQQDTRRSVTSSRFAPKALVLGALLAAFLPGAVPGAVAQSNNLCPFSRTLCLFEGEDFTGKRFTVQALHPQNGGVCVSLVEHGWEGRAYSAINTASGYAYYYDNEECSGYPELIPGNGSLSSLSFTPKSVFVF
ncbi:MAG: peptidase inhibitor family I36 protein, partial [Cystobacter sp.]